MKGQPQFLAMLVRRQARVLRDDKDLLSRAEALLALSRPQSQKGDTYKQRFADSRQAPLPPPPKPYDFGSRKRARR